jgi:hypothetical protein
VRARWKREHVGLYENKPRSNAGEESEDEVTITSELHAQAESRKNKEREKRR